MRLSLVRPPDVRMRKGLSHFGAIPPIGLAYVAAVAREAGHDVRVVDGAGSAVERFTAIASPVGQIELNGLTCEETVERIPADTDLLGVTHMFLHEWPIIQRIVELAKARIPDLRVVLGGENATAFWPWIFRDTEAVDFCVRGEGEATLLELMRALEAGESPLGIPGVVTRETREGSPEAGLPARERDVDRFPEPAWDLFPIPRYLDIPANFGVNRGRSMPMLASRGCPYQCTFCSSPDMWTTRYVTRNPRAVVDELIGYVDRYGIENVDFVDLTAVVRRDWILEFAQTLVDEKLDVTWQLPTGTRSEALDAEVLALAYRSGLRNLTYAPESGSARLLRIIRKKVDVERLFESLVAAQGAGLVTRINIIIGHPQELWSDRIQSMRFLFRAAMIGCHDASVMVFAPTPGSVDFKELLAAGDLVVNEEYYYSQFVRSGLTGKSYNRHIGDGQIKALQYALLLAFYGAAHLRRPWRIVELVRGIVSGYEKSFLQMFCRVKLRLLGMRIKRALTGGRRAGLGVGAEL